MRVLRRSVWILAAASLLAAPGVSMATSLATDDFSYPDGAPFPNGGTGWVNAWGGNGFEILGGQAVSSVFGVPPKYADRSFDNPGATGDLFVSFDLTAPDFGIDDYLGAQLWHGVNTNVLLWGKPPGSTELWVGNSGLTSTGIDLEPDTTVHLVAAFHIVPGPAADLMLLWVDPDETDYFDAATGNHSADAVHLEAIPSQPGRVSLFAAISGVRFDNLVIGDDASSVGLASAPPAVPSVSPGGLGIVAVLVLAIAACRLRASRVPA